VSNLIYSLAYGSDSWHQAVLMVDSMRTLGKFDGDIIIYSDQQAEMNGAQVIYDPYLPTSFTIMGARWEAGSFINTQGYDKIAMIDADVIAVNPVADLFNLDFDGVSVAEEFPDGRVFHGNSPWSIHGIPFAQEWSVHNAGVVIGNASYWHEFSSLMWSNIQNFRSQIAWPYQWIDQQVLNHLARTGEVKINQLPDDWVCIFRAGRDVNRNTKLVHMLPNGKERMMRVLYGMARDLHKPVEVQYP
jgi:hypothetical protein